MRSRLLALTLLGGCASAFAQIGPPDNTVQQESGMQAPLRLQADAVLAGPPPKSQAPDARADTVTRRESVATPLATPAGTPRLKLDANFSSMEALPPPPRRRKGAR